MNMYVVLMDINIRSLRTHRTYCVKVMVILISLRLFIHLNILSHLFMYSY